ncbi:winged helix-turn-helix transcriptional regulator [uncultured Maribacter sp.]|uniref:LexA family protein n=1 Tax=uncultured Maribacter sp. TaxID=431308 RepID=UPI0030D95E89|tara:strand:+ start:3370 stop:3603 length:234 start_codon:yes stop_codon:yes gene_type:complete
MGGVTGGAIDAIDALTKRQKAVLKLIATNTTITYTEIAEALGINESPMGKHINALKTKGFLKRHGGTQGYWEVKSNN